MNRKNRITGETWESLAKKHPTHDPSPAFDVTITTKQSQMIRLALCKSIELMEDEYEYLGTPSERMQHAQIMQEFKDIADLMRDTMYASARKGA